LIDTFLEQDHFKYVRALGAFYLRLTGRPQDIYEKLEPLYSNCSKLKYRDVTEWRLVHTDEFIDELLTKSYACGIALPRLPKRSTLQDAGYLDDGPRPTALKPLLEDAGGVKEYLKIKMDVEQSTGRKEDGVDDGTYTAIVLWENRFGKVKQKRWSQRKEGEELDTSSLPPGGGPPETVPANTENETTDLPDSDDNNLKRKADRDHDKAPKKPKKKKMKKEKYGGTLFKKSKAAAGAEEEELKSARGETTKSSSANSGNGESNRHEEGSEEYWNEQRARLGLMPLK
jgi:pre-mRNA-splicing factor 38A